MRESAAENEARLEPFTPGTSSRSSGPTVTEAVSPENKPVVSANFNTKPGKLTTPMNRPKIVKKVLHTAKRKKCCTAYQTAGH